MRRAIAWVLLFAQFVSTAGDAPGVFAQTVSAPAADESPAGAGAFTIPHGDIPALALMPAILQRFPLPTMPLGLSAANPPAHLIHAAPLPVTQTAFLPPTSALQPAASRDPTAAVSLIRAAADAPAQPGKQEPDRIKGDSGESFDGSKAARATDALSAPAPIDATGFFTRFRSRRLRGRPYYHGTRWDHLLTVVRKSDGKLSREITYLSRSPDVARDFADRAARGTNVEPVILEFEEKPLRWRTSLAPYSDPAEAGSYYGAIRNIPLRLLTPQSKETVLRQLEEHVRDLPAAEAQQLRVSFADALDPAARSARTWILGGTAVALALGTFFLRPIAGHYSLAAQVSGWAGNVANVAFPLFQILKNHDNLTRLRQGGPDEENARLHLAGVNALSQAEISGGKLLNLPLFLSRGNPALLGNIAMRVLGSWYILLQLSRSGRLPRGRILLFTAAALAWVAASVFLRHYSWIAMSLAVVGTAVFAYFPIPQLIQNKKALHDLDGSDPAAARAAREGLRGLSRRHLLSAVIGNSLYVPVYLAAGLWINQAGNIIVTVVPWLMLRQLTQAGLYPKNRFRLLTVAAGVFLALMTAAFLLRL